MTAMIDVLSKILKFSTEVKTAFGLAAFGIGVVVFASIASDVGEGYIALILICVLLALCYCVYATTRTPGHFRTAQSTEDDTDISSQLSIDLLISRSDLPMYLTDENMIVKKVNRPLLDIMDVSETALLNNRVENLIKRGMSRVPVHLQSDVLQEQDRFVEVAEHKTSAPITQDATVIMDNREVTGGAYEGNVYEVRLHAIWLKTDEVSERFAALVVFFPRRLNDDEIREAGL